MQLDGKRVIVTGGAGGIASSAVRAFAAEGAQVFSLDVVDEAGERGAAEATERGPGKVWYRRCNIADRAAVRAVFADAAGAMGGLDALVHVAAIERSAAAEDITDDDWNLMMDVNLRGTFVVDQEAFPYLRDGGGGAIVNFASGAALYPYLEGAHYSAAKGGVISWTRTIAHEWGKHNIRAVAVNPSIWTPMYDAHRARLTPEELERHDAVKAERIPLGGKLGNADTDIAPVLVFLVSDAAKFITAQVVSVDGGMVPLR